VEDGFTLPELLVAITILGIIMVAIGSMIVTAFRTTATVRDQLSGSRGPKMASRYWVPDVESSDAVNSPLDPPCGSGTQQVATMTWKQEPSTIDQVDVKAADGPSRTVTWWRTNGTRAQLRRDVCGVGSGTPTDSLVVVADLDTVTATNTSASPRRWTLDIAVPDRSQPNHQLEFSVTAHRQVTP
jgi:prepilin-type N-terminal cleavage/methylation domain-containing protein